MKWTYRTFRQWLRDYPSAKLWGMFNAIAITLVIVLQAVK